MSELVTMYPAQANSPETSLSGALTAAGTTVNVVDGSVLPEAPNLLTIGADGSTAETVLMTAKNGNVLTVTRAQNGTTARAWSAGDVIARYFTAADQTAMQENIKSSTRARPRNRPRRRRDTSPGSTPPATSPIAAKARGLRRREPYPHGKGRQGELRHGGTLCRARLLRQSDRLREKPGDFANASHAHAGYAEVKIFSGVSVAASAWVSDSTYAAYPYAASIACPGVTASHVPEVVFGATEAASGNFAPVALSGSGTVKIYAATKPTAAITVQSITCIKAVS